MTTAAERDLLTARLLRSTQVGPETRHLEFEVANQERFDFRPGQFVSMTLLRNGRQITRAYSIASEPRGDNRFAICLNRVRDGLFSNFLCDAHPGVQIEFHGPHGYFVPRDPLRSSVFLAAGTGVAPVRGMIHWIFRDIRRNAGRDFWLLFGTRTEDDIYYRDEFLALAMEQLNFHYLVVLSRPGPSWTGLRGYVQEHLPELVRDHVDMDAYICGLKDMVTDNRNLLASLGWDRRSVFYERFG